MINIKNELTDEKLNEVTGGAAGPDPSTYLYKAEIIIGVRVKSQPLITASDVCTAPKGTIIYVTDESCGNNFVYCMFKGDRHREYGYITYSHFVKCD